MIDHSITGFDIKDRELIDFPTPPSKTIKERKENSKFPKMSLKPWEELKSSTAKTTKMLLLPSPPPNLMYFKRKSLILHQKDAN